MKSLYAKLLPESQLRRRIPALALSSAGDREGRGKKTGGNQEQHCTS